MTRLPLNAWAYITNRSPIVTEGFCFSLSNVSGRLLMIGQNYFEIRNLNLVGGAYEMSVCTLRNSYLVLLSDSRSPTKVGYFRGSDLTVAT